MMSEWKLDKFVNNITQTCGKWFVSEKLQFFKQFDQTWDKCRSYKSETDCQAGSFLPGSSVDIRELKCLLCTKYLSVLPVYICKPLCGPGGNVCGRCKLPEKEVLMRNAGFETVAKHLLFPCSFAPNCQEVVCCGDDMFTHEQECFYRLIDCLLCNPVNEQTATQTISPTTLEYYDIDEYGTYAAKNIAEHFMQFHPDAIFNSNKVSTTLKKDVHLQFVLNAYDLQFWVIINYTKKVPSLDVSVIKITESDNNENYTFVVYMKDNENCSEMICRNLPVTRSNSPVKLTPPLYGTYLARPQFKCEIDILIKTSTELFSETKLNIQTMEEKSNLLDIISSSLHCPVCLKTMEERIFMCELGHSICEKCKINRTSCPSCFQGYREGARNYQLEETVKNLSDFDI